MFRAPIGPLLVACGLLLAQWPVAAADDPSRTEPGTASVAAPDADRDAADSGCQSDLGAQCGGVTVTSA